MLKEISIEFSHLLKKEIGIENVREIKMPGDSEELYDFDRRIIEGAWDLAKANNFYL